MKLKTRISRKSTTAFENARVNLPTDYPWKVLDKLCLDLQEYLAEADFSKVQKIVRNRDFSAYLELAEAWGLSSCNASTDTSIVEIRTKCMLASLIKKFQFPTDRDKRIARATEIFFGAEEQCRTYNLEGYKNLIYPETDWGVKILHHARVFLVKLLGDYIGSWREMLDRSRHGPGATIGTKKGNTSLYHKFAEWPYSCTIDAFRYARFTIETDQRWFGALQNDYRRRLGIPKHYPLDMQAFWAKVINVVDGNRIAFVPKDAQKERTIAIEPP